MYRGFQNEINQAMKGFQQGGRVGGVPGKSRMIKAHGGEVVLNKKQQSKILNASTLAVAKRVLRHVGKKTGKPVRKAVNRSGSLLGMHTRAAAR